MKGSVRDRGEVKGSVRDRGEVKGSVTKRAGECERVRESFRAPRSGAGSSCFIEYCKIYEVGFGITTDACFFKKIV